MKSAPKPTRLKIAEGDARKVGKRKLEAQLKREANASSGYPPCPEHLTGRARAAWEFWVPELEIMQIDKRPDAVMLAGACQNYEWAVEADLRIKQDGIIIGTPLLDKENQPVLDKNGNPILLDLRNHPALNTSNKAWTQVRQFCAEFGLSPASRTRIAVEKPDTAEEDLLKLLASPRAQRAQKEAVN